MSREIKFRAWDGERMWYDVQNAYDYLGLDSSAYQSALNFTSFGNLIRIAKEDGLPSPMQFTGLHDKNGKEIYEGDIVSSVHFKDVAGRTHYLFHEVRWSDSFHGWFLLNCQSRDPRDGSIQLWVAKDEKEVVGNIYENPELLESADAS